MNKLMIKFFKSFNKINDYYDFLINETKQSNYVGITNEWIIDNFYLLVEQKTAIDHDKKDINRRLKNTITIYYYLKEIITNHNYNLSIKTLISELRKYQTNHNTSFSYAEIASIKNLILFIYTDKIKDLCLDEKNKLNIKEEVSKKLSQLSKKDLELSDFIDKDSPLPEYYYIYELNQQLAEFGTKNNYLFKDMNEYLKDKNVILKDIINEFYNEKINNNILISNMFSNLKDLFEYSDEELLEKVSKTEKLLLEDNLYKEMTLESKNLYRNQITKLAKKSHISELDLLKKLYDRSSKENYHIGFQLFEKKNYTLRTFFYIFSILIISGFLSYITSTYFIKPRWLGFIILFIPISQVIIQFINIILAKILPPVVLPKLDYSQGIPEESTTMVVIPTIVSSKKKIKEMFDILETFYLINKSGNLYFTLLGDVKASNKKDEDYDEEIANYGIELADKLNKKYNKDLFYYIYRRRFYNEGEDSYLGYERKRGALLQFNKVLLNKVDKELSNKWFKANTLLNNKLNIKYVITLDTDTRLVLNTALNLVGAMAHPLNKPKLNKEGTKVIAGYGIMQPRVSVDIEATNKSLYSQIFAGVGGFDTYSAVVPNVYQDTFGEGSFIGKGIYDLEIFDKVLGNAFPENLILSHDLLEGNYLRCGYVSDLELMDDFPDKFLVDMTRQHRWARGDTQIIGWLFNKVRNAHNRKVKNPINFLGKYKILDNILRLFQYPMLLLILILGFTCGKYALSWIGFIVIDISLSILFFIKSKVATHDSEHKVVYYKNLLAGGKSVFLRSYITLAALPYYALTYMDAFFRTIYRLTISHKNLLNWLTAEDAAKNMRNDLKHYIKTFYPNMIVGIAFAILGIFYKKYWAIIFTIIFFSAPFVLYLVSRTINLDSIKLDEDEDKELLEIAHQTWNYFSDNLKEEYNYLIPDNYQENRENKLDSRTSPTAIGYSLTSIVGARELGFITDLEAIDLISSILETVGELEKWHGHLYNWYDIKTKSVINPRFVSTVDSGNFIASLVVVREYLEKQNKDRLVRVCDKLIYGANFRKLYTKKNVFSIGFDEAEGRLSIYNYNNFASESRLTSYLAICLGDISSKHWFSLDKSLTTHGGLKGLISWSGTSFEYYMPLLFMKNYPNTLLDESYNFARVCQKDYIEEVSRKLPWGISEAAYNELDNSLNYKYKAFATPYLKAKEDKENRIVLSPYASLMALELYPKDVYNNLHKFKKLDMYGEYGLYESYDCDNKGVVKAFFAHHQGMILAGIVNYLKDGAIKNYFHNNVAIRTFDILLKEKVQIRTNIDMKMANYKKYNYDKEKVENDIRAFNYISYMPEVSVLSNKKYCLLMNDRGNSFSRYRTLQLNRYRKITEQDYGIFLYIRDLDTDYVWSNTYAPLNKKPDHYEVVFASDKIKYMRSDGPISTKTEITVTHPYNGEVRKITFRNDSDQDKVLELTTYTEVILSENMDDVSHRTFNNMFISSSYDKNLNALIMRRKSRTDTNINNYMAMKLYIEDPLDKYSYETERANFIGRNHTAGDPVLLKDRLTNYVGDNLDPVAAIRNRIIVEANSTKEVYILVGFGRSREQVDEVIKNYSDDEIIEDSFKVSALMNAINTKNMNITGSDMRLYNIMLNYLYQTTKLSVTEERMDLLRKNSLNQSGLWKFGISGDRPIILVSISDISDLSFVFNILKAFEYYKNNSIFVDIIIVNNENSHYAEIVDKEINDEIYRMYSLNSFYHTPGIVKVIDGSSLSKEEISLLNIVPRLRFIIKDHQTLNEAIEELQKSNHVSDYEVKKPEVNLAYVNKEKLLFDNGYGGFRKNGDEYVIYNKNTPKPWSNVIANREFGTIVTNNGCGYTYAYNSSEFKITSWTNDIVVNDKSEGFKFDDLVFDPEVCIHGFGYSILACESENLAKEVTEFVAKDDPVKIYLVKLTNKNNKNLKVKTNFWINPTFGNFEEKTARHILSEFMGLGNYMKLRNAYSIGFSDVCVYMSSSEKIEEAICDKILTKSIIFDLELKPKEEKTISFVLVSNRDERVGEALVKKYTNVDNAKKELKSVKDYWNRVVNTVEVKTPDDSFNFILSGWYLYQAMASRIMAKAGFYQVSGAFGYRDQLQDSMNISLIQPDFTKNQILINAAHQFVEGDVLHWWHEASRFGLRSRYKDDYLWLVLATVNYINMTGDKDILDIRVPYVQGSTLGTYDNEKTMNFSYSPSTDTLLEHCIKSLKLAMSDLGPHKLPLMGGGDWNDGMNRVGIKGKGESVWLGFFLYSIIEKFVKLMKKVDSDFDTSKYTDFNEKLKDNLNTKAWDKNYYLRAYFDNGDKLGSSENSECRIDLISQSFAIISEVADKKRSEKVLSEVEKQLVDHNLNIVKLLTPPFEKSLNNPGYIMNYPKGIRENGGQYTHAVAWYILALIKAGEIDKAYKYYQMINPINRTLTKDEVLKYQVEPYVIAADIYSNPNYPAQGGWTWYTGSAGWFYNVGIRDILGFKKSANTLKFEPKVPEEWKKFNLIYHYMDTTYNIEFIRSTKEKVVLDNKESDKLSIKLVNDKKEHSVKVHFK